MEKKIIRRQIAEAEAMILAISEKIALINDVDSMNGWIIKILKDEPEICKYLHFPAQKDIKNAILTLIENQSVITNPIVNILSKRIGEFIATIGDLYNHKLRGPILDPLLSNFVFLNKQLSRYYENHEHLKTIPNIDEALRTNRLHVFKSRPKEPDIRVALRAFYEDKNRDNRKSMRFILNFVFDQLNKNVKHNGFISQPRHAWWALLTLVKESDSTWLQKQKLSISKIVDHLCSDIEYSPRADAGFGNIVPELDSIYNERSWMTINAIRLIKENIELYISPKSFIRLKTKIDANLQVVSDETPEESLKYLQNKLILLYDALDYYNTIQAIKISNENFIDLKPNKIGDIYYDDSVMNEYKPIKNKMIALISDKSKWKTPTQSSMIICSSPGQGKSALVEQIIKDITKIVGKEERVIFRPFTMGTHIHSAADLKRTLENLNKESSDQNVRIVFFDEFDKAPFDFYTPFLPFLENKKIANQPLTFYIFAQSSFPSFEILKAFSKSPKNTNRSIPDFITRLSLGNINIPNINASPQQRILSLLGIAKGDSNLREISNKCLLYFAASEIIHDNRILKSEYSSFTEFKKDVLVLKRTKQLELAKLDVKFRGKTRQIRLDL